MRIDGNDIAEAKDEALNEWVSSGDPSVPAFIIEEALDMFIALLVEKGI